MPETVPDSSPPAPLGDTSTTCHSGIKLYRHEYAENSFILSAFTGQLLLSRQDLEEAYRQLDDFLYPNPGFEPRIAEVPK